MPSSLTSLDVIGVPEEVPPTPPVIPIIPTFLWAQLMKLVTWFNSLSTLQKILFIAGVSGSAVAVVGLSRRKNE